MYCLKCGKETGDGQLFCESCLEGMAAYPVKADAKVSLPHRTDTEKFTPRKRPPQPEELLAVMRRKHRRLVTALVAVCFMLAASVAALVYTYQNMEEAPAVGRNYTITTPRRP